MYGDVAKCLEFLPNHVEELCVDKLIYCKLCDRRYLNIATKYYPYSTSGLHCEGAISNNILIGGYGSCFDMACFLVTGFENMTIDPICDLCFCSLVKAGRVTYYCDNATGSPNKYQQAWFEFGLLLGKVWK